MPRPIFAAVVWLVLQTACFSQDIFAVQGTERGKAYLMVIGEDGTVSVNPLRVVNVGADPVPFPPGPEQPLPDPGPTTATMRVKDLTTAAINGGGNPTSALGLSAVYSLAADKLEAEAGMTPLDALSLIKSTSDAILAMQGDGSRWDAWRAGVTAIVDEYQRDAKLATKAQHVAFFREVAEGLNRGTASHISRSEGKTYTDGLVAVSEALKAAKTGHRGAVQAPLFGGLDIERLMELIKLIVFLFSLFGK